MKKKYELPEEDPETEKVNEPAVPFNTESGMTFSPPLTEEELKNALTTDDVIEWWCSYIDKKFDK